MLISIDSGDTDSIEYIAEVLKGEVISMEMLLFDKNKKVIQTTYLMSVPQELEESILEKYENLNGYDNTEAV